MMLTIAARFEAPPVVRLVGLRLTAYVVCFGPGILGVDDSISDSSKGHCLPVYLKNLKNSQDLVN